MLQQAVEQGLIRRAPDLPELQRPELGQARVQRSLIHLHHRRRVALDHRVARHKTHRRQLDQAFAVQHQHHRATDHIAKGTVGLHPVPRLAQLGRQAPAAQARVFGDEPANEDKIVFGDHTVSVV